MDTWATFFATLAAVSAALLTIAFLVFQIKASYWANSSLRHLTAVFTLAEFGTPLIVSLVALMPGSPWRWAAWIIGGLGVALALFYWTCYWRTPLRARSAFDRRQAWLCVLPLLTYAGLILAGSNGIGEDSSRRLLAAICLWFIASGGAESWMFFTGGSQGTEADSSPSKA